MKTVMATIDFSEITPRVVEHAVEIARALDAELCLVHVGPPEDQLLGHQLTRREVTSENARERHRKTLEELETLATLARERGVEARPLFVLGNPTDAIHVEMKRVCPQLIVVGSHGRTGLSRLVMGSVSEGLLRVSACPVLVVTRAATR